MILLMMFSFGVLGYLSGESVAEIRSAEKNAEIRQELIIERVRRSELIKTEVSKVETKFENKLAVQRIKMTSLKGTIRGLHDACTHDASKEKIKDCDEAIDAFKGR